MTTTNKIEVSRRSAHWSLATAVFLAVAVIGVLSLGGVANAQSAAVGRMHAQKAARLAEQGKCKGAVFEYSKAYEILKDPAILFNRAECQRKLNRNQEALADYEHFLRELPKAPNRPVVEERISDLHKKLNVPPGGQVAADDTTTPPAPVPAAPAPILDDDAESDSAADATRKDLTWAPPGQGAGGVRLGHDEEPAKEVDDGGTSIWVWVGLGLVLVAVGAGASVLILGKTETDIPESGLGNYKF